MSGWCWSAQNTRTFPNETLHTACLAVWALSGLALGLSQIVFLIVAARLKPKASLSMTAARPESADSDRPGRARVIILVAAGVILAMVSLFVFALSQMPS